MTSTKKFVRKISRKENCRKDYRKTQRIFKRSQEVRARRHAEQDDDNRLVDEIDKERVPAQESEWCAEKIRKAGYRELPHTAGIQEVPDPYSDQHDPEPGKERGIVDRGKACR